MSSIVRNRVTAVEEFKNKVQAPEFSCFSPYWLCAWVIAIDHLSGY